MLLNRTTRSVVGGYLHIFDNDELEIPRSNVLEEVEHVIFFQLSLPWCQVYDVKCQLPTHSVKVLKPKCFVFNTAPSCPELIILCYTVVMRLFDPICQVCDCDC